MVARRQDGSEAARYQKLTSVANSVTGAWGTPSQFASNSLYFFPNGAYLLIDVTGGNPACSAPGIEYGSYSWNPATQDLTLNAFTDSDGCSGFTGGSDGTVALKAVVSAGGATLTITAPGSPTGASFTRLTP